MPQAGDKEDRRGYDFVPEWQLDPVPLRRDEPETELERFLRDRTARAAAREAPAPSPAGEPRRTR